MSNNNKQGYTTIAPLFTKNSFSNQSVTITNDILSQLSSLRPGGKFVVRSVKSVEDAPRTRPTHYLEYVDAEQLENEKQAYLARRNSSSDSL